MSGEKFSIAESVVMYARRPSQHEGCYVVEYEPCGTLVVSENIERARRYDDFVHAMTEYNRGTGRLRPDGRPDRPLTAWTIEVVHV